VAGGGGDDEAAGAQHGCLLSGKGAGKVKGIDGSEGSWWWSQICSMDRERLFSSYDTMSEWQLLPPGGGGGGKGGGGKGGGGGGEKMSLEQARQAMRAKYEPLVTTTQVQAITARQLLERHTTSPVRYVQIDVEGFDDQVLDQLPLEDAASAFRPTAIVFEYVLLGEAKVAAAVSRLRSLGYTACIEEQNVVALALS